MYDPARDTWEDRSGDRDQTRQQHRVSDQAPARHDAGGIIDSPAYGAPGSVCLTPVSGSHHLPRSFVIGWVGLSETILDPLPALVTDYFPGRFQIALHARGPH